MPFAKLFVLQLVTGHILCNNIFVFKPQEPQPQLSDKTETANFTIALPPKKTGEPLDDSIVPGSPNLGVLPQEFLDRKILYQCRYYTDKTTDCMTVKKCESNLRGKSVELGSEKELYEYSCKGTYNKNLNWEMDDGLMKMALKEYIQLNSQMKLVAFGCTFFVEAVPGSDRNAPKKQLFECRDPVDRTVQGGESEFAGGVEWVGTWAGSPTEGLSGTITAEAMDDDPSLK